VIIGLFCLTNQSNPTHFLRVIRTGSKWAGVARFATSKKKVWRCCRGERK